MLDSESELGRGTTDELEKESHRQSHSLKPRLKRDALVLWSEAGGVADDPRSECENQWRCPTPGT
jgi:hypothetical protein